MCAESFVWVLCWRRVLPGKTPRPIWAHFALCQHGIRNEPNCIQKAVSNRLASIKWPNMAHRGLHVIYIILFFPPKTHHLYHYLDIMLLMKMTSQLYINKRCLWWSILNMLSPVWPHCGKMSDGINISISISTLIMVNSAHNGGKSPELAVCHSAACLYFYLSPTLVFCHTHPLLIFTFKRARSSALPGNKMWQEYFRFERMHNGHCESFLLFLNTCFPSLCKWDFFFSTDG